ncbi:hypothetical protein [Sinorhizobium fredii]|nr:hypothetical protein [Sinorhizobium fredii]
MIERASGDPEVLGESLWDFIDNELEDDARDLLDEVAKRLMSGDEEND